MTSESVYNVLNLEDDFKELHLSKILFKNLWIFDEIPTWVELDFTQTHPSLLLSTVCFTDLGKLNLLMVVQF